MSNAHKLVVVFAAVVFMTGCGATNDALMELHVRDMNQLADAMIDGDDDRVEAISNRMESRSESFDKLSDEERRRLLDKYSEELSEATGRLIAASASYGVQKVQGVFEGLQNDLQQGVSGFNEALDQIRERREKQSED